MNLTAATSGLNLRILGSTGKSTRKVFRVKNGLFVGNKGLLRLPVGSRVTASKITCMVLVLLLLHLQKYIASQIYGT
jgi:hypothetical protein